MRVLLALALGALLPLMAIYFWLFEWDGFAFAADLIKDAF